MGWCPWVCSNIPDHGKQIIHYYGFYSNVVGDFWSRENRNQINQRSPSKPKALSLDSTDSRLPSPCLPACFHLDRVFSFSYNLSIKKQFLAESTFRNSTINRNITTWR